MSSNLDEGNRGLSNQSASSHIQNNNFANFDPAMSSANADASAAQGRQAWSFQPDHPLALAQPQPNPSNTHSPALYQQPQWHNSSSATHLRQNGGDGGSDRSHRPFFPNSFPPTGNTSPGFQNSTFSAPEHYHPHVQGPPLFDQRFPQQNTPQGTNYSSLPLSYNAYQTPAENASPGPGTVAPQELQQKLDKSGDPKTSSNDQSGAARLQVASPAQHMHSPLPHGKAEGNFVVTSVEDLERVSKSQALRKFVHIGTAAQDVLVTKSTLPAYIPRKSRNEIMKLLASDSSLKAKLNKKLAKKPSGGSIKGASARVALPPPTKAAIGVKRRTSDTPSEADSEEDDSASSSSEEESILPPLPPTRPSKAVEAVKYDTIKALWRVPYRSALSDDIRKGLADFWEVTKTIRDRWKSDAAAVKQAEETKKVNELPLLKERVANQRDMLETALRAALSEGHKDIIEHLGENLPLMNALAVSLQDRARDADYNGGLAKAILEMLSRCKTMTEGTLDKTGIAKILPRFVKRGDEAVKTFAKKIIENAATASKKRKEANKASLSTGSQIKTAKAELATAQVPSSPVAGTKRPREGDIRNGQPTKKVAAAATPGSPGQPDSSPTGKKPLPPTDSKTPVTTTATAKKVVTKPTNFFSSLQPAYKKAAGPTSGNASNQTKQAVSSTVEKKPLQATVPAGIAGAAITSKPAFSFAETMANLTRPKEAEPAPKREDSAVLETPEEKLKRLRKEQRRSLRVSFKPESELVDVRYFVHDPDEEEGHDASQVRDVGDLESEGRMFKLQHQEDQDRMDLDEDDDDADNQGGDLNEKQYPIPSLIDFSDIPEDERNRNYIPYGGGVAEPDSPETQAQKQREADTLMVVYTQASDIPPSPKEATEPIEETASIKMFGDPPEDTMSRLGGAQEAPNTAPQSSLPISTTELSALIGSLTQQSQQPQQPQQPQQINAQFPDLEKIVAQFSNQNQQHQQPPAFNQQQYSSIPNLFAPTGQEPQTSFQQSATAPQNAGAVDVSALLASLQGQLPSAVPPAPNMLASIAQFGQQQQQLQPQGLGLQHQQQQQQQYPYENEERRRMRENLSTDGDQQRPWQTKKPPRDPSRPTPKFILPCKYFKEGKCLKGANCTYRHDMVD